MGNRATVIFTDGKDQFSPAVYLHWNGGPESVYAFLKVLDDRGHRADQDYECARFIQIIGDFFDQDSISTTSLGVANGPKDDTPASLSEVQTDHGNNGFYLVNRTVTPMVVRRFHEHYVGKMKDDYSPDKFKIKEMTTKEVQSEYSLAIKDDTYSGIIAELDKQRGKKQLDGLS
jgi:hypothetical protein